MATTWTTPKEVRLLSGGNPQVPKGDGDEPVRYFIAACPDWKQGVCKRLDELITQAVPDVQKAVRWNSPFYGAGQGWFVSYHCFTNYVKVTFFQGARLDPPPPVTSSDADVRAVHVDADGMDEARLLAWFRQAAALPGWSPS